MLTEVQAWELRGHGWGAEAFAKDLPGIPTDDERVSKRVDDLTDENQAALLKGWLHGWSESQTISHMDEHA